MSYFDELIWLKMIFLNIFRTDHNMNHVKHHKRVFFNDVLGWFNWAQKYGFRDVELVFGGHIRDKVLLKEYKFYFVNI